jgi:hypothetical protein
MSEMLELNREEITRLSKVDDYSGHAWALYLILKKNMDLYTGVVHIKHSTLLMLMAKRLNISIEVEPNHYLAKLINLLITAEVILDYLSTKDLLSVKLPLALSETCLENNFQH